MECPYCQQELLWEDYFGTWGTAGFPGIEKKGDIYRCDNEECESEIFNYLYHTYLIGPDNLIEGYPC